MEVSFVMLKEKSCGAIVCHFDEQNETVVLLIKHKNGGHWSFPKGHVERNETETETALREIKEETGLSVDLIDGFRESVSYCPKSRTIKEVVYFLAHSSVQEVTVQEEEVSIAVWIKISKVTEMVSFDNDKRLIEIAKKFIKKSPNALENLK